MSKCRMFNIWWKCAGDTTETCVICGTQYCKHCMTAWHSDNNECKICSRKSCLECRAVCCEEDSEPPYGSCCILDRKYCRDHAPKCTICGNLMCKDHNYNGKCYQHKDQN